MSDYTWPSVFFSYAFFAISLGVAIFFCVRSLKDGYWGKDGEEIKYRMLEDDPPTSGPGGKHASK